MDWISLKDSKQLDEILAESIKQPVLIYKHSTRCNISRAAFDRLERNWDSSAAGTIKLYFLDLLAYREISNRIEQIFKVEHHSPQILLISQSKSILDLSHYDIDFDSIKSALTNSVKAG